MPSILGRMSAIARRGSAYKTTKINNKDIGNGHHPFVYVICNNPGQSQEWISKRLSLNKSTVARALTHLEEKGFINRIADKADRRVLLIYPTDKLLELLPEERAISAEWNAELSEGISQEEMNVFLSVLERMSAKSIEIIDRIEAEGESKLCLF